MACQCDLCNKIWGNCFFLLFLFLCLFCVFFFFLALSASSRQNPGSGNNSPQCFAVFRHVERNSDICKQNLWLILEQKAVTDGFFLAYEVILHICVYLSLILCWVWKHDLWKLCWCGCWWRCWCCWKLCGWKLDWCSRFFKRDCTVFSFHIKVRTSVCISYMCHLYMYTFCTFAFGVSCYRCFFIKMIPIEFNR